MNAATQPVNATFPGPQTRLLSYHNWIHLNPGDRVIVKQTGCAPERGTVPHHGTFLLESWTHHLACSVWTTAG